MKSHNLSCRIIQHSLDWLSAKTMNKSSVVRLNKYIADARPVLTLRSPHVGTSPYQTRSCDLVVDFLRLLRNEETLLMEAQ